MSDRLATRELLEEAAERLEMVRGAWRLEARFENGKLLRIDRHDERVPAAALARFDHGETV